MKTIIAVSALAIMGLSDAMSQMYPQRNTEDFNCPANTKTVLYESFEFNDDAVGKRISGPFLKSNRQVKFNTLGNVTEIIQYKIVDERLEVSSVNSYYWNEETIELDSIVSSNGIVKKYDYKSDSIRIENRITPQGITRSKTLFSKDRKEFLYEYSIDKFQLRRIIFFDDLGRRSQIEYYNNGALSQTVNLYYKSTNLESYCKSFYKERESKHSYLYSEYDENENLTLAISTNENDLLTSKSERILTYDRKGNWATEKTRFYSTKIENSWASKILKLLKRKEYDQRRGYSKLNKRTIEYY